MTITDGTVYFEYFNVKTPNLKKYLRLNRQHFPAGIDVLDDRLITEAVQNSLQPEPKEE